MKDYMHWIRPGWEPYEIDMDAVILAARKAGCCLETNAEPNRLYLNDVYAQQRNLPG